MAESQNDRLSPWPLALEVHLETRHRVCDLSGGIPFQISANVGRFQLSSDIGDPEKHHKSITVLRKGTVLDIPRAITSGLFEIVEKESYDRFKENGQPLEIAETRRAPTFRRGLKVDASAHPVHLEPSPAVCIEECGHTWDSSWPCNTDRQKYWNGGTTWWRFCSDPDQLANPSDPTESPEPKVRGHPKQVFVAKAKVARPPTFHYHLKVTPTTIMLSNPSDFRLSVDVTLKEPRLYTVNTYTSERWPLVALSRAASLHHSSLFHFDVFDLDTNATVSELPSLAMSVLNPKMARGFFKPGNERPYARDNFVEFEPETTVKGFQVILTGHEPDSLLKKRLRIERPEGLLNRRLGIRLRRRIAWWAAKTIDQLFVNGAETILTEGLFTLPLEVTPDEYAEFRIVE